MSKSFICGFIVGMALLVAGVGAAKRQDQDAIVKERNEKQYQAEIVDATPVQIGVLTPKQQFHSRLHNGAGMPVNGKTISEWIALYKGQRMVLTTLLLGRRFLPTGQPSTAEEYFSEMAKESDAIIRGSAINKASQITEDDLFLFTDYDVVVSGILKNNAANPLNINTTITLTCVGGKIVVDDVVFKAGGNDYALLPMNASDDLLFLKFIPETGEYKLARTGAAFELNGTSVRPLSDLMPLSSGTFKDEALFLKMVRKISGK